LRERRGNEKWFFSKGFWFYTRVILCAHVHCVTMHQRLIAVWFDQTAVIQSIRDDQTSQISSSQPLPVMELGASDQDQTALIHSFIWPKLTRPLGLPCTGPPAPEALFTPPSGLFNFCTPLRLFIFYHLSFFAW
jgi:hypothetical protein